MALSAPVPPDPSSTASSSPASTSLAPLTPLSVSEDHLTLELDATLKKKKKKKRKKLKDSHAAQSPGQLNTAEEPMPPVLCISRNKHWRYISSYHGPWLQLPLELLESLLTLNLDPATLSPAEPRDSRFAALPPPPAPAPDVGGTRKPPPPPIDPGVFRSVVSIRRLIDEASDLAVRAASGLSAAALAGVSASSPNLGMSLFGEPPACGRAVNMSATRAHRLRALAVQRLAQAYKADEIAASVMVMQGASALDDIAERVLKVDPHDLDAQYVHFFHEKIPSRQLAESTTTKVLDDLIAARPQRLEYFRTRGVVRCFRDEYAIAVRDFTHALKEARALRKARHAHVPPQPERRPKGKKGKRGNAKTNGRAPPNGTSVPDTATVKNDDDDHGSSPPPSVHPAAGPDAPDPIEPQLLFLRGAAYLAHAVFLIESTILRLEEVRKPPAGDGQEMRLCYIENGRYGGVEIGNPAGPLGTRDGPKAHAYATALGAPMLREPVEQLVRKAVRDLERFLAHFDSITTSPPPACPDPAARAAFAFRLAESLRPGANSQTSPPPPPSEGSHATFTTYHPLLVEAHFSLLLAALFLGDFGGALHGFARAAALLDGLEGYPVFLPARSMAQAEFVEVLERLASGWDTGVHAPPRVAPRGAIEGLADAEAGAREPERDPAADAAVELECARMLLAPAAARQRERAANEHGADKKKPLALNIPLHGPRVEIVLAWLGAVHLPVLDAAAAAAAA